MFYDKLETFIKGLESRRQCQESYGNPLVPIIQEKLSNSMTQDHGNRQWKLNELRDSIQKEVNILQEGKTMEAMEVHFPTASKFTTEAEEKS